MNMKKIFYLLIATIAFSFTMVSCGDDGDENIKYSTTADQATAGTYVGTITKQLAGSEEIESFPCTVTLESVSAGVSNITVFCDPESINSSAVVNIWNAKYDFFFVNNLATVFGINGIAGKVLQDGTLTTSFTLSKIIKKKNYEYIYKFEGTKQQ